MSSGPERGTRERILEVSEAFLGECGYHGTRLHQIAERVGIQKASLFHYFPSKEHLYHAVMDQNVGDTERTILNAIEGEGSPLDKVASLVGAYVELVAAHPQRTKILLRHSLGDAPAGETGPDAERVLNMVVKFVAEGQKAKVFAPLDPVALVLGVVGMVAFFFTSGPVLAPSWFGDPASRACVERIKRHAIEVVQRCLSAGDPRVAAAQQAVG
jgi:AcrR family transcriptional regulator